MTTKGELEKLIKKTLVNEGFFNKLFNTTKTVTIPKCRFFAEKKEREKYWMVFDAKKQRFMGGSGGIINGPAVATIDMNEVGDLILHALTGDRKKVKVSTVEKALEHLKNIDTIKKGADVKNFGNPVEWQKQTRMDRVMPDEIKNLTNDTGPMEENISAGLFARDKSRVNDMIKNIASELKNKERQWYISKRGNFNLVVPLKEDNLNEFGEGNYTLISEEDVKNHLIDGLISNSDFVKEISNKLNTEKITENVLKRLFGKNKKDKYMPEYPTADVFNEPSDNKPKKTKSATSYRGISIQVMDDRYYTLGKFYNDISSAESKIDRYWDYDEPSNSVV